MSKVNHVNCYHVTTILVDLIPASNVLYHHHYIHLIIVKK